MRLSPLNINIAKIPIKRIRVAIGKVVERVNMLRVIEGNGLEQTANGIRLADRFTDGGATYTPPFFPTLRAVSGSNRPLTIAAGTIGLPYETDAGLDHEIPEHHCWPVIPQISGTDIDGGGSSVPTMAVGVSEKTHIYLASTFIKREAVVGATDIEGDGSQGTGITGYSKTAATGVTTQSAGTMPHTHPITDPTHSHEIQVNMLQPAYHYDTANPPEFEAYVEGIDTLPTDTELIHYIYFGFYDLEADGSEKTVNGHKWWWRSDIPYQTPTYIKGADTTSGDNSANPTAA